MNRIIKLLLLKVIDGGGGLLPLSVDFSTLPNGSLPAVFSGSTWSIVSGKAINTPTLGAELLTDPGLEAAYTAGQCGTLTLNGSPTLVDETTDIHGGAHAQKFTGVAFNNRLNWPTVTGVVNQWYLYTLWAKRTAGSSGAVAQRVFQTGMLPANTSESRLTDAAYTQKKVAGLSTTTNAIFCYPEVEVGSSAFDSVIADDGSLKAITYSSLFTMIPATQPDIIVKIMPDVLTDDTYLAAIVGGDAYSSPGNYIIATIRRHANILTLADVDLFKKVGSTYTPIFSAVSVTIASNAWFEVRRSGSTVKVYYNNAQVDSDRTVNDAVIVAGAYHGWFSSGGNALKQVFFQPN